MRLRRRLAGVAGAIVVGLTIVGVTAGPASAISCDQLSASYDNARSAAAANRVLGELTDGMAFVYGYSATYYFNLADFYDQVANNILNSRNIQEC